jgi:hypothetical protein
MMGEALRPILKQANFFACQLPLYQVHAVRHLPPIFLLRALYPGVTLGAENGLLLRSYVPSLNRVSDFITAR